MVDHADYLAPRRPDEPTAVKWDGDVGLASGVIDRDTSFDELLARMLPDVPCEVLEVVEVRAWGNPDDLRQWVKARVRKTDPHNLATSLDELKMRVRLYKPRPRTPATEDRDVNVVLSDWQIGKAGEAGGGTKELVKRLADQLGQVQDYLRDLKRVGKPYRRIRILKGGDIVDQCFGFGPAGKQLWTNELNLTDQIKLAMDLDVKWHKALADRCDELRSFAVASNHGQPRNAGNFSTDDSDSYDLLVHHMTSTVLATNDEAYGHVSVMQPQDPLVASDDSYGYRVGLTHGHQAGGGGKPIYKMDAWWRGQDFGGLVDVDLMVAGHFHHPYLLSQAGKTLLGAPANDGGSRWLTSATGEWADAGTLVFTTTANGWGDYAILTG